MGPRWELAVIHRGWSLGAMATKETVQPECWSGVLSPGDISITWEDLRKPKHTFTEAPPREFEFIRLR